MSCLGSLSTSSFTGSTSSCCSLVNIGMVAMARAVLLFLLRAVLLFMMMDVRIKAHFQVNKCTS